MRESERAILKTLIYADIFDYPLTSGELWRYLVKKMRFSLFQKTVQSLLRRKLIYYQDPYYTLKKRRTLISLRQKREKSSQFKFKIAAKIGRLLKFIPTIYYLGISGALAMNNAPEKDDIDLFIITAPHTLWLTRLISTLLLDIFRLRRRPRDKFIQNKVCLNMFMDSTKLSFPSNERTLYLAHEITQLKPLINKHQTYEMFLAKNHWLAIFLPHVPILQVTNRQIPSPSIFNNTFELIAKKWQLAFMQKRRTTEKISRFRLQFHPHDVSTFVLKSYAKRVKSLRKT